MDRHIGYFTMENPITKFGMIFGMGCFILSLSYCFFIGYHFEQFEVLKRQELILKHELQLKYQQAVHFKEYQKQLTVLKKQFTALSYQMPMQNELHLLLDEISLLSTSTGLTLTLFAPQSEVPADFYMELPIKSTLIGTYKQLALFISHMAAMNRLVVLNELNIRRIPSWDKKRILGEELIMNLTTTIYRYPI